MHLSLTALCRTHCESVVEGMGSVLTAKNEKRGSLSYEALQRETLIRWQGPDPASETSTRLIEQALDKHFKGRTKWHFTTKTDLFLISKIISRKTEHAKKTDKIAF